jgi:hypothetical protein
MYMHTYLSIYYLVSIYVYLPIYLSINQSIYLSIYMHNIQVGEVNGIRGAVSTRSIKAGQVPALLLICRLLYCSSKLYCIAALPQAGSSIALLLCGYAEAYRPAAA